jgi:hypothetical protein
MQHQAPLAPRFQEELSPSRQPAQSSDAAPDRFANNDESFTKPWRRRETPRLQSTRNGATIPESRSRLVLGVDVPYLFEFDAENGLLQGRLYGHVTSEELKEYYLMGFKCVAAKQPRSGITDMTGITLFEVTPQTVRELASMAPVMANQELLRVIVASSPEVFGMARMFESHGEATRPNLHVVRTCKEALIIVGVQSPKYEPINLAVLGAAMDKK